MNMGELNKALPNGISAEFVGADDASVDDEILLYVDDHAEAVGGIQFTGRGYCANCWTSVARNEMHFGRDTTSLKVALQEAVRLLKRYRWI
jgi:hypothetical protein